MKPKTMTMPVECSHRRRATSVEQVFELPVDPDTISWPAWAIRPGTLGYRGDTRRWNVQEFELKTAYGSERGLAKNDWLVLEKGHLKAFSAEAFKEYFELVPPASASLLRYVPEIVEHDELDLLKEGLPEDCLMSHYRRDNERTLSCLLLTGPGGGATLGEVAKWTHGQCVDAEIWALHEHVHASDNEDCPRLPMPEHVRRLPTAAGETY